MGLFSEFNCIKYLEENNFQSKRNSSDNKMNATGLRLLNCVITFFTANGRMCENMFFGKCTFTGTSIINYLLFVVVVVVLFFLFF
jgi:hypothetical protein